MELTVREFQDRMWAFWSPTGRPPCLLCWKLAVCLHEIEPRSTYRDWYKTFPNINSIPVCNDCHQACERREYTKEELKQKARARAKGLGYDSDAG